MKNVIKREQCMLACGLPSVNILSKVSKFKVLLYLKKKERIGQTRKSTYHGAHYPQSLELVRLPEQEPNGTVLKKAEQTYQTLLNEQGVVSAELLKSHLNGTIQPIRTLMEMAAEE